MTVLSFSVLSSHWLDSADKVCAPTLHLSQRIEHQTCIYVFRTDILAAGTSVGHVAMWKYSSAANIHEPEDRWTLQPPCNLPNDGGISDIVVRPPPPILWLHLHFCSLIFRQSSQPL